MITEQGKTIFFEQVVELSAQETFKKLLNPKEIPLWWSPNVAEVQTKDKSYQIIWDKFKSKENCPYGDVLEFKQNQTIKLSWYWDSISPDFYSEISIKLETLKENKTRIEFRHEKINVDGEVKSHHDAWKEILKLFTESTNSKHQRSL